MTSYTPDILPVARPGYQSPERVQGSAYTVYDKSHISENCNKSGCGWNLWQALLRLNKTILQGQDHRSCRCKWSFETTCEQPSVRSCQLSVLSSTGWEIKSSLRATGWRPSVADWGGGMSASCTRINCSLARATDDCIVHRGTISSCQSVATSGIVKRF